MDYQKNVKKKFYLLFINHHLFEFIQLNLAWHYLFAEYTANVLKQIMVRISKTYIPKESEKYMCEKHKVFFRIKLNEWKKELVRANNEALYNGSMDDNSISADIVDQASSYTDKNVEMKAINRQIKLISEIDKALMRIRDDTYGYCLDTAEPIGLKRLMARPVAKYTIAAQEKHEKDEKVHADD